jgi:hypothetical protein
MLMRVPEIEFSLDELPGHSGMEFQVDVDEGLVRFQAVCHARRWRRRREKRSEWSGWFAWNDSPIQLTWAAFWDDGT